MTPRVWVCQRRRDRREKQRRVDHTSQSQLQKAVANGFFQEFAQVDEMANDFFRKVSPLKARKIPGPRQKRNRYVERRSNSGKQLQ